MIKQSLLVHYNTNFSYRFVLLAYLSDPLKS